MKSVSAAFAANGEGKRYEYFVRDGDEPVIGDYIVTSLGPSASHYNAGSEKVLNVARVVAINDEATDCATKFYLWLIPAEGLRTRATKDKEAVEREKRRKAALAKLRELAEAKALIDSLKGSDDAEIQALIKAIQS
jgi:hypothetical protein